MNPRARFIVPVADLEKGQKDVHWTLKDEWLAGALEGTEATPRGDGDLNVTLSKNGREVVVRGRAKAPLSMPCARTLDPVDVDIDAELFLLLQPAAAAPAVHAGRKAAGGRRAGGGKAAPQREAEAPLTAEDAARDTYDGEQVVLDDFVREFILLELPMFPLRSDLRSEDEPAIERPPGAGVDARPLDPRLAPLAALASRMRDTKE